MLDLKILALLCLVTLTAASVYEVPVVVQHLDSDLLHYEDEIPVKSYVIVPAKHTRVYAPAPNHVVHPALSSYLYGQKYTVHYPSGLYHGPHGVGIYDPKFHDELEQAYYNS